MEISLYQSTQEIGNDLRKKKKKKNLNSIFFCVPQMAQLCGESWQTFPIVLAVDYSIHIQHAQC
jgi:hypothetical protein